jgi:spore maturation protein CgeB
MKYRSILYIGTNSGTSRHRASAMEWLGHEVCIIEPRGFLPKNRVADYWLFHQGALWCDRFVARKVLSSLPARRFDLVWVDGGDLVSPDLVCELKKRFGQVVNYCIDDPYGQRDGEKWRHYLRAVPFYDLVVVLRECNVAEAYRAGARNVLRVSMTADEIAHWPRPASELEWTRWRSDVLFAGTWMPERGPFLAALMKFGVPLSIYGDRWHKAPEWSTLRPAWKGPGLYRDADYALAIACAKVCIGLLSKGNRDETTTRSFEIPLLRSVLCAERTSEHCQLYRENEEAVFWSTAEECADKCRLLLTDDGLRASIAARGQNRCIQNQTLNQPMITRVLAAISRGRAAERQAVPMNVASAAAL